MKYPTHRQNIERGPARYDLFLNETGLDMCFSSIFLVTFASLIDITTTTIDHRYHHAHSKSQLKVSGGRIGFKLRHMA